MKKLISLLLCITMLILMLPYIVYAEENADGDYFFSFDNNILPTGFSVNNTEGFSGVRNGRIELSRPENTEITQVPKVSVNFSKMEYGALSGRFNISFDFTSTVDKGAKVYVQAAPNTGSLLRMEATAEKLRFITGGSGEEPVNTAKSYNFVPGQKYHISLSFDWDLAKCSIYVDGQPLAEGDNLMASAVPEVLSSILMQHDGTTGSMLIDNIFVQRNNGIYIDDLNYNADADKVTVSGTVQGADTATVVSAIYFDGMLRDVKLTNGVSFELTHENIDYHGYDAKLYVLHSIDDVLPLTRAYETNELEIKTYSTINARKKLLVTMYKNKPYPDPEGTDASAIGKVGYALSLLYLDQDIPAANDMLRRCMDSVDATQGENSGVYFQMSLLQRIYICYNEQLEKDVKEKIEDFFYTYLNNYSAVAYSEGVFSHDNDAFLMEGTGNHHVIRRLANLIGVQILKDSKRYCDSVLSDGKSVTEHYDAWLRYWYGEIPYRIDRGPEIEYFSSGYAKYTIDSFFTLYDVTEDERLKELCKLYLDYLVADMTVLSVNGIFGGARGRSVRTIENAQHADYFLNMIFYNSNASAFLRNSFDVITGKLLNTGSTARLHPDLMSLATTQYKPPFLLTNIALSEREPYEYRSYPSGRGKRSKTYSGYFEICDPGRYMRYSYVTPEYTVGSMTYDRGLEYTEIQQQNRYVGVHFKNSDAGSTGLIRVFPDTERNYSRGFNDINAAASGSAMLVSSLPEAKYYDSEIHRDLKMGMTKMFYDNHVLEDGWMFSYTDDNNGYIAIKPSKGSISGWENETSSTVYMLFDAVNIPVVIQAGSRSEYGSFENFIAAVKNTGFEWKSDKAFAYQPTHYGDVITFFTDNSVHMTGSSQMPLESVYIVDSPYLKSYRGSGKVVIQNTHGDNLILDFYKEH